MYEFNGPEIQGWSGQHHVLTVLAGVLQPGAVGVGLGSLHGLTCCPRNFHIIRPPRQPPKVVPSVSLKVLEHGPPPYFLATVDLLRGQVHLGGAYFLFF